jgi:hypothetical protein
MAESEEGEVVDDEGLFPYGRRSDMRGEVARVGIWTLGFVYDEVKMAGSIGGEVARGIGAISCSCLSAVDKIAVLEFIRDARWTC